MAVESENLLTSQIEIVNKKADELEKIIDSKLSAYLDKAVLHDDDIEIHIGNTFKIGDIEASYILADSVLQELTNRYRSAGWFLTKRMCYSRKSNRYSCFIILTPTSKLKQKRKFWQS